MEKVKILRTKLILFSPPISFVPSCYFINLRNSFSFSVKKHVTCVYGTAQKENIRLKVDK